MRPRHRTLYAESDDGRDTPVVAADTGASLATVVSDVAPLPPSEAPIDRARVDGAAEQLRAQGIRASVLDGRRSVDAGGTLPQLRASLDPSDFDVTDGSSADVRRRSVGSASSSLPHRDDRVIVATGVRDAATRSP